MAAQQLTNRPTQDLDFFTGPGRGDVVIARDGFEQAAEARDFTDVHALAERYGKELLLTRAAEVDLGFDVAIFAQMLRTLNRFDDSELPIAEDRKPGLRAFFASWEAELAGKPGP